MKKNGFSLAELIMVSAIVGILVATGMMAFRVYDKGIRYIYSNTYYALDRGLYNATEYYVAESPELHFDRAIFEDTLTYDGNTEDLLNDSDEAARRLCMALIQYINPVNRTTACNTISSVSVSGDDTEFNKTPMFTATNGVRFWVSQRFPSPDNIGTVNEEYATSLAHLETNSDDQNSIRFFIIFADMNGTKGPNSMRYVAGEGVNGRRTVDPDIFAFAAVSLLDGDGNSRGGRIVPLGVPEVDTRYMSTRIQYEDNVDDQRVTAYSTPSRALLQSKAEAWGYYGVEDMTDSHNRIGANDATVDNFINDNPLSYGDLIRSILIDVEGYESSKIYDFLGGETFRKYFNDHLSTLDEGATAGEGGNLIHAPVRYRNIAPVSHASNVINRLGYDCAREEGENPDNCKVFVDKFVY